MKFLSLIALAVTLSAVGAESQYAEQQHRAIKSLSQQEVEALTKGEGMGFAKLAELNHFPGPRHVLDLAQELELTPEQLEKTQALFDGMQSRAIAIGLELLAAESDLDFAFARNTIDADTLKSALLEIGELRARLRFVHLEAHLRQTQLLTAAQVDAYDELRGYSDSVRSHDGHSSHH